jgi:hypothetical protein
MVCPRRLAKKDKAERLHEDLLKTIRWQQSPGGEPAFLEVDGAVNEKLIPLLL